MDTRGYFPEGTATGV